MIDIHCHILPLLDDGPQKMSEAVAMAKMAASDGITHIVATPHVNDSYTSVELNALGICFRAEVERLRRRLFEERVPLGILLGSEISYTNVKERNFVKLGMNNTSYLLIEFPHNHLPSDAIELIFHLVKAGFYPIIAHPERNPSVIENPRNLLLLRGIGALVQITATSLSEACDQDVRRCAFYLLKKGVVDFIATDAHNTQSRPPVLSKAYELVSKLAGEKRAENMMRENPTAVLQGEPIYSRGPVHDYPKTVRKVKPLPYCACEAKQMSAKLSTDISTDMSDFSNTLTY